MKIQRSWNNGMHCMSCCVLFPLPRPHGMAMNCFWRVFSSWSGQDMTKWILTILGIILCPPQKKTDKNLTLPSIYLCWYWNIQYISHTMVLVHTDESWCLHRHPTSHYRSHLDHGTSDLWWCSCPPVARNCNNHLLHTIYYPWGLVWHFHLS